LNVMMHWKEKKQREAGWKEEREVGGEKEGWVKKIDGED
jgi:hypothetical protein